MHHRCSRWPDHRGEVVFAVPMAMLSQGEPTAGTIRVTSGAATNPRPVTLVTEVREHSASHPRRCTVAVQVETPKSAVNITGIDAIVRTVAVQVDRSNAGSESRRSSPETV